MRYHGGVLGSSYVSISRTSPLSVIAGVKSLFDVDATLSASYSGSGTKWANLTASPDDGSIQSAYDFTLESTPTFNGSANNAAAYWSFSGSNYFQIAAGNTTVLNNMAKTTGGSAVTIGLAFKTPALATARMYGTGVVSGLFYQVINTGVNRVQSAASGSNNLVGSLLSSTNYLILIALDVTSGTMKSAINARTFTSETPTFNTNTTNGAAMQIAADGATNIMPSGSLIYGCYFFNKLLSDTNLSGVVDQINLRHNRTYA